MVQDASKLDRDEILKMIDDFNKQVYNSLREYKEPTIFLHEKEIEYFKKVGMIR